MNRLRRMLAGGDGLRIGRLRLSISRFGLYFVLRSGPDPVGVVLKPRRWLRLDEAQGRYRRSGRLGPLYWRTFRRDA